jgi:hypothetical protein
MTRKILAAGDVSEEAEQYLRANGAVFNYWHYVCFIELPETARIEKGGYTWQYSIHFGEEEDDEGNYPPYCEVELYINVEDTRIFLKEGSR